MKGTRVFVCAFLVASCATVSTSQPEKIDDWLKADYQQMKKRLIHLERENSILVDENEQVKKENHSLAQSIEQLSQELTSLKKQHHDMVERLNAEIARLGQEKELLEQESNQRITEQERLAKEAALRYEQEIQSCKAQLVHERGQWENERTALKQAMSEKESSYARRIQDLSNELAVKDATITTLRKDYGEQTQRLEKTLAALETKNKECELLKEELNRLRPTSQGL